MGSRLLRAWMLAPLTDLAHIGERLDAVEALVERPSWREELRQQLGAVGDLERLVGRLASGRVGPRDLLALAAALERVERIIALLTGHDALPLTLRGGAADLDPLPQLRDLVGRAIADDPPALARGGGVIRAGYHADVDELRELARSGKSGISQLE